MGKRGREIMAYSEEYSFMKEAHDKLERELKELRLSYWNARKRSHELRKAYDMLAASYALRAKEK